MATRLAEEHGIDISKYIIYFHNLQIVMTAPTQFGFKGDIPDRVSYMNFAFEVNKKQQEFDDIFFCWKGSIFDELAEEDLQYVQKSPGKYCTGYRFTGEYFRHHHSFRSALVTFVNRKIPRRHRKLKASARVFPSEAFEPYLHSGGSSDKSKTSNRDIFLVNEVQLKLPLENAQENCATPIIFPAIVPDLISRTQQVIINNGQIYGSVCQSSTGQVEISFAGTEDHRQLLRLFLDIKADPAVTAADINAVEEALRSESRPVAVRALSNASRWLLEKADGLAIPCVVELIKEAFRRGVG
ncbi:hypothetical protein AYO42_06595 [Rhizomicrobium sp. SCGC AG-212-E05]|nr:hypothetical protein AYO42_06595 [Rhizomicrobium sp. SCGC AG-212-E05]